jgi:hypothetical protein
MTISLPESYPWKKNPDVVPIVTRRLPRAAISNRNTADKIFARMHVSTVGGSKSTLMMLITAKTNNVQIKVGNSVTLITGVNIAKRIRITLGKIVNSNSFAIGSALRMFAKVTRRFLQRATRWLS